MAKRISRIAVVLALAGLACAAVAQIMPPVPVPPDAYVRGNGAIHVYDPSGWSTLPNLGVFGINVVRCGSTLYGGFNYAEINPKGVRIAVIVSKEVTSMVITGRHARIEAKGYFNRTEACLILEVDDLAPGMLPVLDRLRIVANGCMLDVNYYDKQGSVVKGDIVVWQKPAGVAFAKGNGAIEVPNSAGTIPNIGTFCFKGELTSAGPLGMICYTEYNPATMSPVNRPVARIYVPKLTAMGVQGNEAKLGGPGTFNGKPAFVTVYCVDNAYVKCPDDVKCIVPDFFAITAEISNSEMLSPAYHAEGKVVKGDIVVGRY